MLLAYILTDGIHSDGYLYVYRSVEVCVTSHRHELTWILVEDPISYTGCISEEVASSIGVQFIVGGTRRLFYLEGEGDGSWRLLSDGNEPIPDVGSVQIMLGLSKSAKMTLAPSAMRTRKGPMADPAPSSKKY